jgi:hypothetical protein
MKKNRTSCDADETLQQSRAYYEGTSLPPGNYADRPSMLHGSMPLESTSQPPCNKSRVSLQPACTSGRTLESNIRRQDVNCQAGRQIRPNPTRNALHTRHAPSASILIFSRMLGFLSSTYVLYARADAPSSPTYIVKTSTVRPGDKLGGNHAYVHDTSPGLK